MNAGGGFIAGSITGKLFLDKTGWDSSVSGVKKDEEKLGQSAKKISENFTNIGKKMSIAGVVVVAALGGIIKKTADAGDEIAKLSKRTGVSTEVLSGYSLAAKLADASLEGLGTGLKMLSRNMYDASNGVGEAKEAFDDLGISVINSDGTLRDSNDVMLDVAERFKNMDNGARKTALAMDIFGRSGADLIPMLNLGRDGLQQNYEEAKRLGLIYSKEAAEGAERFNDSLTTLKGALSGAGRQIAEVLMPIVTKAVEKITDIVAKVTEWTNAHPALTSALTTVAGSVGGLMLGLGPLLLMLPKVVQGWQTLTAVLQTSTAALAATLAGLTALVGGAVMVYNSINTMIKAKSDSVEADYAMAQSNADVGEKLREMADASGVSRAELIKLTDAYGGNNTALLQAINKGKDQNEILQKMHKWVIKHREEVKKQDEALKTLASNVSSSVSPALEEIKKKEEFLAITVDVANDFLSDQETQFLKTAAAGSQAYSDMVSDVNSSLDSIVQKSKESNDKIKDDAVESTTEVSSRWDDLVRDITSSWAEGIRGLVEGTTSFKDFLATTWGNVKQTFFRMIADMVTQWITKGITNMVSSAAEGAAAVSGSMAGIGTTVSTMASTVGGIIGGLATTIASAIGTIATGIATALVTLATAIATAITTLAAAAPALLEIGLVAAAVYTAFKLGESLVGAIGNLIGGGGDNSDITDWLKVIYDTIILYGIAIAGHIIFVSDKLVEFFPKVDNLANSFVVLGNLITDRFNHWGQKLEHGLDVIAEKVALVASTIANLSGAASGAVSTSTRLMMIHGTPTEPEYIIPHTDLGRFVAGMERAAPGTIAAAQPIVKIQPLLIDKGSKWMIKFIQRNFEHGALQAG